METKTTREIGNYWELSNQDEKWVRVDSIIKRLFNSDIPIKYTQPIIDELLQSNDSKPSNIKLMSKKEFIEDCSKVLNESVSKIPKGDGLSTCRKCGSKRKRFGGASFYYPERESGLCESCWKDVEVQK